MCSRCAMPESLTSEGNSLKLHRDTTSCLIKQLSMKVNAWRPWNMPWTAPYWLLQVGVGIIIPCFKREEDDVKQLTCEWSRDLSHSKMICSRPAAFPYVGYPLQGWALSAAGHIWDPGEDVPGPHYQRQPAAGVCSHADASPESHHSWWWVRRIYWKFGLNHTCNVMLSLLQAPVSSTELWLSTTYCLLANCTTTSLLKNLEHCWKFLLQKWHKYNSIRLLIKNDLVSKNYFLSFVKLCFTSWMSVVFFFSPL